MKNTIKQFEIIAFIAIIGFSFGACGDYSKTGGGTPPRITTESMPGGTAGVAYNQTLTATGDKPITWSIESGALPEGLSLAATTGVISGTPGALEGDETFNFTVKATNSAGSGTKQLSITIAAGGDGEGEGEGPTITTESLPNGTVGVAYNQTLAATGDDTITWSLETGSSLPADLELDEATGYITGTPEAAGTFTFTVIATNATSSDTKELSIVIALIEMVQIQGGPITMGTPEDEDGRKLDETRHEVTLTAGFYMGIYPVTQAQYEAVTETTPSEFKNPVSPEINTGKRPVEMVSWYDAIVFCNKLSMLEDLEPAYSISGSTDPADWGTVPTAWSPNSPWYSVKIVEDSTGYRLPTEAQWEYACRAGTWGDNYSAYNTGSDMISNDTGWYISNSGTNNSTRRTHSVGEKQINDWGLYDMHGNVWEWCWDKYAAYTTSGTQTDPTGGDEYSGDYRVQRGGSWSDSEDKLRSAARQVISYPNGKYNHVGFRLVRPAQ
jgi:formylglycine-generating enzyme required for sulfatase activity